MPIGQTVSAREPLWQQAEASPKCRRRIQRTFVAIALVFVVLAAARIASKRPWVDEAWFTGPALDLATHGRFGTPVLEPTGSHLTLFKPGAVLSGINQHTYWIMPLYPLTLAAWGKLFGFSVFSMRVPSVFWGLLLLGSVWIMTRRLGGSEGAAALATAVLALEFGFVDAGSDGRMDMMSAALGFAGLTAYLSLRERGLVRAALVGHALCAAALFTHPNGMFAAASLMFCTFCLDLRRVTVRFAGAVALPYAVGATAWGLYILRAPAEFASQFSANAAQRSSELLRPLHAIREEFVGRYLLHHFLPAYTSSFKWVKVTGLLLFLAAIGAMIVIRSLRRHSGCRLLLWLAALRFLMMAVGASWKLEYYMVHALPFYAAITGIAGWWFWTSPRRSRRLIAAATVGAYFIVQLAVFTHLVTAVSAYRKKYLPAVGYVRSILRPGDVVAGAADLAFAMGFYNPQLVDDIWLGHWSGKRPTIVVVDDWYYSECIFTSEPTAAPYNKWVAEELKRDFTLVKVLDGYLIYHRVK
jgi:4-amino-4-deoxy-L-arabinose transferase-like glycosyltransferase